MVVDIYWLIVGGGGYILAGGGWWWVSVDGGMGGDGVKKEGGDGVKTSATMVG